MWFENPFAGKRNEKHVFDPLFMLLFHAQMQGLVKVCKGVNKSQLEL